LSGNLTAGAKAPSENKPVIAVLNNLRKNAIYRGKATTGAEALVDCKLGYAALKGRSSTVMLTLVSFSASCEAKP